MKFRKINLSITGCEGRMGQQIIKTARSDKNFKIVSLTENNAVSNNVIKASTTSSKIIAVLPLSSSDNIDQLTASATKT